MLWHWFLHYTGSDNGAGSWYLFYSGFGANFGELTVAVGLFTVLRHRNCHVKGCWKLGHPDPEHGHPACRRHHSHAHKIGQR